MKLLSGKAVAIAESAFQKWMRTKKDTQPPACLLTLMNILEQVPEARKFLRISQPDK